MPAIASFSLMAQGQNIHRFAFDFIEDNISGRAKGNRQFFLFWFQVICRATGIGKLPQDFCACKYGLHGFFCGICIQFFKEQKRSQKRA